MSCFALWLAFLGIGQRELARRMGIGECLISAAIQRNARAPDWIGLAADHLGVPAEILMTVSPLSEAARPYRRHALARAAKDRLKAAEKVQRDRIRERA